MTITDPTPNPDETPAPDVDETPAPDVDESPVEPDEEATEQASEEDEQLDVRLIPRDEWNATGIEVAGQTYTLAQVAGQIDWLNRNRRRR